MWAHSVAQALGVALVGGKINVGPWRGVDLEVWVCFATCSGYHHPCRWVSKGAGYLSSIVLASILFRVEVGMFPMWSSCDKSGLRATSDTNT